MVFVVSPISRGEITPEKPMCVFRPFLIGVISPHENNWIRKAHLVQLTAQAPESHWLEDDISFLDTLFRGLSFCFRNFFGRSTVYFTPLKLAEKESHLKKWWETISLSFWGGFGLFSKAFLLVFLHSVLKNSQNLSTDPNKNHFSLLFPNHFRWRPPVLYDSP